MLQIEGEAVLPAAVTLCYKAYRTYKAGRKEGNLMAGGRKPGPQCLYNDPVDIEDGTMCRASSPTPGPLGTATDSGGAFAQKKDEATETNPEIDALNLSEIAKKAAAYELQKRHPSVSFTSGPHDKPGQASAMAGNVVLNRNWIKETHVQSA